MFMDTVKEDVKMVGVPEQEARDRVRWTQVMRCVDPGSEQVKEQEEEKKWIKNPQSKKDGVKFPFSTPL